MINMWPDVVLGSKYEGKVLGQIIRKWRDCPGYVVVCYLWSVVRRVAWGVKRTVSNTEQVLHWAGIANNTRSQPSQSRHRDGMGDLLRSLQDPILVAKFQKWFGLEIIEQIDKNPNEKWLPVELRERHDREDVIGSAKTSKNIIYYKVELSITSFMVIIFYFLRFTTSFGITVSSSVHVSERRFSMRCSLVFWFGTLTQSLGGECF